MWVANVNKTLPVPRVGSRGKHCGPGASTAVQGQALWSRGKHCGQGASTVVKGKALPSRDKHCGPGESTVVQGEALPSRGKHCGPGESTAVHGKRVRSRGKVLRSKGPKSPQRCFQHANEATKVRLAGVCGEMDKGESVKGCVVQDSWLRCAARTSLKELATQ